MKDIQKYKTLTLKYVKLENLTFGPSLLFLLLVFFRR